MPRRRGWSSALNAFEPECLHVYPSMAVLLADEKRAGRLRSGARGRHDRERAAARRRWPSAIEDGVRRAARSTCTPPPRACGARTCGEGEGHPPVRGPRDRRERRRGRPAVPDGERGARVLVTNLVQLRAAADPLRGLRRRHDRPGAVPVRAHAAPHARDRRPRRRRAAAARPAGGARARAPAAVRGDHRRPRRARVPGAPARRRRAACASSCARVSRPPRWPSACASAWASGWRRSACRDPHVEVEPCAALERPPAGKLQLVVAESEVPAAT